MSNFEIKINRISWTQNIISMKSILILFLLFSVWSIKAQSDTTQINKPDSAIYFKPDIEASYPSGITYWARYLQRNLQYPSEAQRRNVQGTVVTKFIVDTNGAVHDVIAISGPDELRAETIRIIKNVDIWIPAICNGKKVNSWKTQSVSYRLEN
jgi:TonB family protein